MTTALLQMRNPQQDEATLFHKPEDTGNMGLYLGRVFVAEVGCVVLTATAVVETVAYASLCLVSLCFYCINPEPFRECWALLQSSSFSIVWNVGNLLIFNPFCTNCLTQEAFARFTIDNWERGEVYRLVLQCFQCMFEIFTRTLFDGHIYNLKYTRPEDRAYIAYWAHQVSTSGGEKSENAAVNKLHTQGTRDYTAMEEGAQVLVNHVLQSDEVDEDTKALIREYDPEALLFALTRVVALYIYGELKRQRVLPEFFVGKTRVAIRLVRRASRSVRDNPQLAEAIQSIEGYRTGPSDEGARTIFQLVKGIVYT